MRVKAVRAARVPTNGYVCLSCQIQFVGVEGRGTRRSQHTSPKNDNEDKSGFETTSGTFKKAAPSVKSSRIRDIIRGFIGSAEVPNPEQSVTEPPKSAPKSHEQPFVPPAVSGDDARQQKLQQEFASQRRKDMLEMKATNFRRVTAAVSARRVKSSRSEDARIRAPKILSRSVRRKAKRDREQDALKNTTSSHTSHDLKHDSTGVKTNVDHGVSIRRTKPPKAAENKIDELLSQTISQLEKSYLEDTKADENQDAESVSHDASVPAPSAETKPGNAQVMLKKPKIQATLTSNSVKKPASQSKMKPSKKAKVTSQLETERKAQLATKLANEAKKSAPAFRKLASDEKHPGGSGSMAKNGPIQPRRVVQSKRSAATSISNVDGFDSLQSALSKKSLKTKAVIEKVDAIKLNMLPIRVEQPPVPSLSHGLERVLFNPGVYQLQDPRSRVYNFDPYLQNIMPVAEFDFNALKEYITSSRDNSLKRIAKEHNKRYVGSTSSMTGVLAHFHFLLSQWRPINTTMLSKTFPTPLTSFTELQRSPSAIFLRWKDGSYAIDADKEFASANVLSMLGKSMEKLLTLKTADFERYRKTSLGKVTEDEQFAPESYHYSTMGDFLMRSQLDAYDHRLPGTGMFDLKTRAVVSIRMDVSNYEQGTGYQIKSRQGEWESYEREYYDMIRAAFLKYSMQVRMGRMDGIFVAFHNIERIFGFQYISLPEMDSTIHGQWDTSIGDQEFKLSLDLFNKALDKATAKFPETSIRLHFETRDAQTPFMYIFAEPVTEEQVAEIQSANDAKIQDFERNILGLDRGEQFKSEEPQEDDGKWENIQADVQKEMDKDELSLGRPEEDLVVEDTEDVDVTDLQDDGQISEIEGVLEEGPLYANKRSAAIHDDAVTVAADSKDDDAIDEDDMGMAEEIPDNEEEGVEDVNEAGSEDSLAVNGDDEAREDAGSNSTETTQVSDQDTSPTSEDEANLIEDEVNIATDEKEEGNGEPEADAVPLSAKDVKKLAKAEYIPPIGEESSDFQTEADQPFLDAIDEELLSAAEATNAKPDILAMTLTLRNKVNGQYTLRPERLTKDDRWSIEYSLIEVPTQQRARALYEACQTRRRKKMDAPLKAEDANVINMYIENLRKLSRKGRDWRKEQDSRNNERPVQVLGQEIARKSGEDQAVD